jgi:hypothetical protein
MHCFTTLAVEAQVWADTHTLIAAELDLELRSVTNNLGHAR